MRGLFNNVNVSIVIVLDKFLCSSFVVDLIAKIYQGWGRIKNGDFDLSILFYVFNFYNMRNTLVFKM